MSEKAFVYGLRCPVLDSIMYIGVSSDLKQRLKIHVLNEYRGNKRKSEWIDSLKEIGELPKLEVIEECDLSESNARERFHIAEAKKNGAELFNMDNGGVKRPYKEKKEKAVQFTTSIPCKYMDALGGKEKCKSLAAMYLINEARTKLKE